MARLLRIEKCEQCGWRSSYDDKCNYVIPHRYFNYEDGIPDWCPLPEAEEATCEICGGQGWYAADDGSGEPAQVQCEACYGTGKRIAEEATDADR